MRRSSVSPAPEWTDLIDGAREHAGVTEYRSRSASPSACRCRSPSGSSARSSSCRPRAVTGASSTAGCADPRAGPHRPPRLPHPHHRVDRLRAALVQSARLARPLPCPGRARARLRRRGALGGCAAVDVRAGAALDRAGGPSAAGCGRREPRHGAPLPAHRATPCDPRCPAASRPGHAARVAGFLGVVGLSLVLAGGRSGSRASGDDCDASTTGIAGSPTTIVAAVEDAATGLTRAGADRGAPADQPAAVALRNEPQGQSLCARTDDSRGAEREAQRSMTITGQGNAEDGNGNSWVVWSGIDCSVKILLTGTVTFNAEETDVATLSRGARGSSSPTARAVTTASTWSGENGGALERRYTAQRPRGADRCRVERWRATLVLAYIRRSGYDAEGRTRGSWPRRAWMAYSPRSTRSTRTGPRGATSARPSRPEAR